MLWSSFVILAKHAFKVGARIIIELPRGCSYWDGPRMSNFLQQNGFEFADFNGCMYGLVAKHGPAAGHPMHKPWRFACWKSSLPSDLHVNCSGYHNLRHTRCFGKNAKESQLYTHRTADLIHKSIVFDIENSSNVVGACAVVIEDDDNTEFHSAGCMALRQFPSSGGARASARLLRTMALPREPPLPHHATATGSSAMRALRLNAAHKQTIGAPFVISTQVL
jgi:hypothetical protein